MSRCKPIQATPALSGEDAKKIIADALKVPTKESVERLKRRLKLRKLIQR